MRFSGILKKSGDSIRAMKLANKGGLPLAESVERSVMGRDKLSITKVRWFNLPRLSPTHRYP